VDRRYTARTDGRPRVRVRVRVRVAIGLPSVLALEG